MVPSHHARRIDAVSVVPLQKHFLVLTESLRSACSVVREIDRPEKASVRQPIAVLGRASSEVVHCLQSFAIGIVDFNEIPGSS